MARKNLIQASFNFDIWGINSSMEDYRLCLHINEFLKWQLKRVHDVEIFVNDAKNIKYFSAYKYNNDIDLYTVELIQNKKLGNILIPELKNIDYLFL
ncbi:MAG TPA: IPExxxVDY family protein, partial [Chitinophagales bacterium]|nr:IPExxxVDY family protein [Chitinophagales bacterium]